MAKASSFKTDQRSFTFDQLAWMSDDDLVSLMMNMEKDREAISTRGRNTHGIEVEICYVQREMDVRNSRRAAHQAWLASMGAEGADARSTN